MIQDNGVITLDYTSTHIPNEGEASENGSSDYPRVPLWIQNNAKWWAEGSITEDEYIEGIEFLINQGIMKIN